VAIRTAVIRGDGQGSYGVGGGIVADSDPAAEYDEALLKARVLSDLAADYQLLETLRWSAEVGFVRLGGHLDRLAVSADALGFAFDRHAASAELGRQAGLWSAAGADRRVRLALARTGAIAVTQTPIGAEPARRVRLGLAEERLDAGDPFLRHKTSRRDIHEAALAQAVAGGLDEAILLNRAGALADGARNSLFVQRGGRLLTPPVQAGALPGVLRAELIAEGLAEEAPLDARDLQGEAVCFVGNSLRGLRRAGLTPRAIAPSSGRGGDR
jgi:para-aminobenzoate synthetase/4-amino-4-deoxychorismate lyase